MSVYSERAGPIQQLLGEIGPKFETYLESLSEDKKTVLLEQFDKDLHTTERIMRFNTKIWEHDEDLEAQEYIYILSEYLTIFYIVQKGQTTA